MATILWCILLKYYKISIKNTLNIRRKYNKKKISLLYKLINKKNDSNIGV